MASMTVITMNNNNVNWNHQMGTRFWTELHEPKPELEETRTDLNAELSNMQAITLGSVYAMLESLPKRSPFANKWIKGIETCVASGYKDVCGRTIAGVRNNTTVEEEMTLQYFYRWEAIIIIIQRVGFYTQISHPCYGCS